MRKPKPVGNVYLQRGSRRWGPFNTETQAWNHLREENPNRKMAAFRKDGYQVISLGGDAK